MSSVHGVLKDTCTLLAVVCGDVNGIENRQEGFQGGERPNYPFPKLCSSGRLQVQIVTNPTVDEFQQVVESSKPDIVYLQGEQLENEEIGSLVWGGVDYSTNEKICGLFGSILPGVVYLEVPNGEALAKALHLKGVSYVLHWTKNALSCYEACHFRHSFLSVIQSSCSHAWDAFQLARASYTLYCVQNSHGMTANSQELSGILGPRLLGDPPTATIYAAEGYVDEENEKGLPGAESSIEIYDDDVNMKVLLCGMPRALDACLLGPLEDGIKAILNIEIRGSRLRSRISAPPPPLQAGAFSRGVVTMRCDVSTSTSSYISLLVSGSAQTCFDDELLENQIKNKLLEKSRIIHALATSDDMNKSFSAPRTSASIACGAPIYEVCVKVPAWAAQVLRQLASENSYRSFAALGIATIQGSSVVSFDKDDSERLLFFGTGEAKNLHLQNAVNSLPSWLRPPTPSQKRLLSCSDKKPDSQSAVGEYISPVTQACESNGREIGALDFSDVPVVPVRKKVKVAALRPIPHVHHHGMLPFQITHKVNGYNGDQGKANLPSAPVPKHKHVGSAPISQQKPLRSSNNAREFVRLNSLPVKKHGCDRSPVQDCSEEEFLRDLMHFLILRGHTRLVPQGGLGEFPDAILNGKRLDLYNLYREVVSRGGFRVGNGINWKGQVFSRMRNHTVTNKMTGVGNALKKHYETYLLDYELAHDDVDGECCLLCHSSEAGDWVNCGLCGEWAHFGCDRRQGLGTFKEYAKKDGLDYICPHCSLTNFSRRPQKF